MRERKREENLSNPSRRSIAIASDAFKTPMRATDKRTMPTSEGLLRLSLHWNGSIELSMLVRVGLGDLWPFRIASSDHCSLSILIIFMCGDKFMQKRPFRGHGSVHNHSFILDAGQYTELKSPCSVHTRRDSVSRRRRITFPLTCRR